MPVFKNNWEKHLSVMTPEQLILPWDSGKKYTAFQIPLSYILLRFYNKYFKAFCTEQTEREDNLASDLSCLVCLVSGGMACFAVNIFPVVPLEIKQKSPEVSGCLRPPRLAVAPCFWEGWQI